MSTPIVKPYLVEVPAPSSAAGRAAVGHCLSYLRPRFVDDGAGSRICLSVSAASQHEADAYVWRRLDEIDRIRPAVDWLPSLAY